MALGTDRHAVRLMFQSVCVLIGYERLAFMLSAASACTQITGPGRFELRDRPQISSGSYIAAEAVLLSRPEARHNDVLGSAQPVPGASGGLA
jgi:hypothetical protein